MKKIMQFKSLRTKILLGFMLLVLLIFGYSAWNIVSSNQIQQDTNNITEHQLPLLIADEKLMYNIADRIGLARAFVLYGDTSYLEKFQTLTEESQALQKEALTYTDSEEFQRLVDLSEEWRTQVESNVFTAYQSGDEQNAADFLKNSAEPMAEQLMLDFESLIEMRESLITESGQDLLTQNEANNYIGFLVAIALLIVAVIIGVYVANMITKPIKQVKERMVSIASGNLQEEPLKLRTKDEVAELVEAINRMQSNIKGIVAEIQHVSNTVSDQSDQLTQSSSQVKEASDQVAVTMEELSRGAETQANTTSDISNSMNEFTNKIVEANKKGEAVYYASQNMKDLSESGSKEMDSSIQQMSKIHQVVSTAVDQVKGLDQQSKEISELVNVIKDVAEQTNLLALNAAIEAARAGEDGQGFAVVADEVRKLAEQVATSVTDITQIVANVQEETNQVTASLQGGYQEVEIGMNQVINTGGIFEQMKSELETLTSEIRAISSNLSAINDNSKNIGNGIEEIASVSQESAAGIEETAASIEETSSSMEEVANNSGQLASLASHLKTLITRFKL